MTGVGIAGRTRVFAILGDPVSHSLSPVMHNAAFRALGIDAVYVPLRCEEPALAPLMRTLAGQGGGGNVTVPHKLAAAEVLRAEGAAIGPVCNTFWGGPTGALQGAETDSSAILGCLRGMGINGGQWLLIGTGGSARAALRAARIAGARIAVRSRSTGRSAEFEAVARAEGVAAADPAHCEVVVNCTPLGLRREDPLPLDPDSIPSDCVGLDLVYTAGGTAWTRALRAAGHGAIDGREVLLEQGAAAFELWFPGLPAPREVMRAALSDALA